MYNDILPTMIDLAGGKNPKLDGSSMKNLWLGKTEKHREFAFISNVHPFWQKAIVGPQFKLIWSPDNLKSTAPDTFAVTLSASRRSRGIPSQSR